jgi:hypothetical protein
MTPRPGHQTHHLPVAQELEQPLRHRGAKGRCLVLARRHVRYALASRPIDGRRSIRGFHEASRSRQCSSTGLLAGSPKAFTQSAPGHLALSEVAQAWSLHPDSARRPSPEPVPHIPTASGVSCGASSTRRIHSAAASPAACSAESRANCAK